MSFTNTDTSMPIADLIILIIYLAWRIQIKVQYLQYEYASDTNAGD